MASTLPRKSEFAQAMANYRWTFGLSMAEAAAKVKPKPVTLGTWANWELDRCRPHDSKRAYLENLVGVKTPLPKKEAQA